METATDAPMGVHKRIRANEIDRGDNPRPESEIDPHYITELAESFKVLGMLQFPLVRLMPNGRYQLVAGERRWRAAQKAGLRTIPAVVKTLDDRAVLEIGIVENVQRADLNAIEEASAYQQLIEKFRRTQEEVADSVGKVIRFPIGKGIAGRVALTGQAERSGGHPPASPSHSAAGGVGGPMRSSRPRTPSTIAGDRYAVPTGPAP